MQGGYNYIHLTLESDIFTFKLPENSWSRVWEVGRSEGGGGGDKEGGARGTAYLEGRLQVLGEAGCPGPVLLAALDLLQQSLPGQKEGQGTPHSPGLASRPAGSQQHPGAARALWEAAFHHPTPPPAVTHHGV